VLILDTTLEHPPGEFEYLVETPPASNVII